MNDDYLDLSKQPEQPVETPVDEAAQSEPAPEATDEGAKDAETTEEGDKPKPKPGSQRQKEARIRAEQMAYEANQRATYLEQQLAQIQAKLNPQPVNAEPKIDDFDNLEDFVAAKADFVARSRIEQYQYKQLEHQAVAESQKQAREWQARLETEIGGNDDAVEAVNEFSYYAQLIGQHAPAVASALGDYIKDSDAGPALVIALGKDPNLFAGLARMSPYKAVAEVGKLEASLLAARASKDTKPKTNAPRPPEPVRSVPAARPKDDGPVFF